MAEARKQDTGMDMFPGYERPTRSNVRTRSPRPSHLAPHVGRQMWRSWSWSGPSRLT